MEKIIFYLVVALFLAGGLSALAQDNNLLSAGFNPDSPFYFLKGWKENIQIFFTFKAEQKASQYLHLSDVRLAEYQKMLEKGKTEIAQKTLDKYEKQLNRAISKVEELRGRGKDIKDISEKIATSIAKHAEVLEKNLQKAPEEAKGRIEKALENLRKGIEKFKMEDETAGWQTYKNEEYGFKIKYPNDWRVAKNILGLEPNLVFCPNKLATDPASEIICKIIGGGAVVPKLTYEEGMIFMYASDVYPVTNNPNYHYLGFGGKIPKYYELYSEGNEKEVNLMLSTFKFSEEEKPYIKVISPSGWGEVWEIGKTYSINWEQPHDVSIWLEDWSVFPVRTFDINDNVGKPPYLWTIPYSIPPGIKYKIVVRAFPGVRGATLADTSDGYFSIIAPNTK
ncbi:MAG: apolipoprotein A1/A4/E family protein [Candidatus Staskawiczbacteria bacterium]|nr:apolipoprotein A1/A4/E family protein [Candidatus Staskawiczbacteria bacterium]